MGINPSQIVCLRFFSGAWTKAKLLDVAMSNEQKMRFFRFLVQTGFKEIEVSYPAASDSDFGFCRELLKGGEVPDDVWIQVRGCFRS